MTKKGLLAATDRRVTIFHVDTDGKQYLEDIEDCAPLIEAAKILADVPPDPETGLRFVCAIPDHVYNAAVRDGWFHDKDAWRRWARDSDNRQFNGGRENPF